MFITTIAPLPQLQRVCSWCQREIAPGAQPATHGIGPNCFDQLEQLEKNRGSAR